MLEMSCRVRGSIVQDEPREVKLLREGEPSDVPGEWRCAGVFGFKSVVLVSSNTSGLHILADGLLDMPVKPLFHLCLVFGQPTLLFGVCTYTAAAGAFFIVDPITPLSEDVPQVPLMGRRWSLVVPGWRTRGMATHWRGTPSLPPLLELPLEPLDQLFLLLDEAILSPDIILGRVFVVKVGLMVGMRSGPY